MSYQIIQKNEKYGIIDSTGKNIVEPVFDYIQLVESEGYVIFTLDKSNAIWSIKNLRNL